MPDQREGFNVGDDQGQDCEFPCEGYVEKVEEEHCEEGRKELVAHDEAKRDGSGILRWYRRRTRLL